MKTSRLERRGFTLVELMVSLIMGMIVSLAAVALARNATTTFHEQARSSTAQMSLRIASDRLRQDLMRASYMSTGNVLVDPKVSRLVGVTGPASARYDKLVTLPMVGVPLRGVAVDVNMALSGGVPAPLAANGLSPDAIYLVGNFKSDEVYTGFITTGGSGGNCAGGTNTQTITIDAGSDAPTYFMSLDSAGAVSTTVLDANAKLLFYPIPAKSYLAQVTDVNGCTNYVPVCNVTTGVNALGATQLNIMVDAPTNGSSKRAVLYTVNGDGETVMPGCGSADMGPVMIAPLALARWSLQVSQTMLDQNDPGIEATGDKFDLVRELFDFDGNPFQREVIAEYMVDMKFGISVDDPGSAGSGRQKVFDSENDPGNAIGTTTMGNAALGPQRVRTVRYRLASRVAMPDRENSLALGAGPTIARYCTDYTNFATCKKWARVRTLNSEVALSNQMGMLY